MFWLYSDGGATVVVDGSGVTHACLIPLRFGQVLEIDGVKVQVREIAQLHLDEDPHPPHTSTNYTIPPLVKTPKTVKRRPSPRPVVTSVAMAAPALGKSDIKKIQGLLNSRKVDGVTLGLSLLESLGATRADYQKVFTEAAIKSVLSRWNAESWGAVAKALASHDDVSVLFQRLVDERVEKAETTLSADFALDITPLHHARIPLARLRFLALQGSPAGRVTEPFMHLVSVPSGSFTMGSSADEISRGSDEDQVDVLITKPFEIGRTVVTQGQWRAVIGTDIKTEGWKWGYGDDFPAVGLSWDDAVLFCKTLTGLERETGRLTADQAYRLPTEAEWEYACRAGTSTTYSFGNQAAQFHKYGWCTSNSDQELHAVAGKMPNRWGLFDMHGNVWEWCADWYAVSLAGGDNPAGPSTGTSRVARGGSYRASASDCRSASRNRKPWHFDGSVGFRVVLG